MKQYRSNLKNTNGTYIYLLADSKKQLDEILKKSKHYKDIKFFESSKTNYSYKVDKLIKQAELIDKCISDKTVIIEK